MPRKTALPLARSSGVRHCVQQQTSNDAAINSNTSSNHSDSLDVESANANSSSSSSRPADNQPQRKNPFLPNHHHLDEDEDDGNQKRKKSSHSSSFSGFLFGLARSIMTTTTSFTSIFRQWSGAKDCLRAQASMALVLAVAYVVDRWPSSYPRNDNHNPTMFWIMNAILAVAALASLRRQPTTRNVQLLSRPQTEEWKGWMQWAFIMYHYYRVYYVYNEIRVFVSAYVWMTGFGNFLYFDKKQDFSLERAISMWLRINYFPLLLSFAINVPLELYYVVPLHTAGFFITMATCYLAKVLQSVNDSWTSHHRNLMAIAICFLVHVLFYETKAKSFLKIFSDEYYFRFQVDKYSAVVGILSGFCWGRFRDYMNWCYGGEPSEMTQRQKKCMWYQRLGGVLMIGIWYYCFGSIDSTDREEKERYNRWHPYFFWLPVAGFLMIRNSSKYLTEVHSQALEFMGRITLETYVLQFHVFMCNKVQNIPIIIPGAGPTGDPTIQFLNMLLCGTGFVALAYWARQLTITTQTTVTDLLAAWMGHVRGNGNIDKKPSGDSPGDDVTPLKSDNSFDRKESEITVMAAAPHSASAPSKQSDV